MRASDSLTLVGTIRTLDLTTIESNFEGVREREVSKVTLDLEAAHNVDGVAQELGTLGQLEYRGPAELLGRFTVGDRVEIETVNGVRIARIRRALLS